MQSNIQIKRAKSEKGFTLLESMIAVGLTTLVSIGLIVGLLEGMEVLTQVTDNMSVDHGHQRIMSRFMDDIHQAVWFNNGEVHNDSGALVLNETASIDHLDFGYPTSDGEEVWVRYGLHRSPFSGEIYLMRTVLSTSGLDQGATYLATGVSNLVFDYFNESGISTSNIPEIRSVQMTISLNAGGATIRRLYEASLRNENKGVKIVPGDFQDILDTVAENARK